MNLPQKSSSLPTPLYPHLRSARFRDVYEPAEDTFLLLDALEKEAIFLNTLKPSVCVEVGSGSGVVLAFLAKLLLSQSFLWAIDRNAAACSCTKQTLNMNGLSSCSDVIMTDLFSGVERQLAHSVDVVIFNPPYVVTPSDEVGGCGIEASWAGGVDGREVTDNFLKFIPNLLSPYGVLYLVLIKENKPDEVCEEMRRCGFQNELVLSRQAFNESLSVTKFYRKVLE